MKRIGIAFCLVLLGCMHDNKVNAQTDHKESISAVDLNLNASSLAVDPYPWVDAIGLDLNVFHDLTARLSASAGAMYRLEKFRRDSEGRLYVFDCQCYSGPVHEKFVDHYFELPIRINYTFVKRNNFHLVTMAGVRPNFRLWKYDLNPGYFGEFSSGRGHDVSLGMDIGIREEFSLNEKYFFVMSQRLAYYLVGSMDRLYSTELAVGVRRRF